MSGCFMRAASVRDTASRMGRLLLCLLQCVGIVACTGAAKPRIKDPPAETAPVCVSLSLGMQPRLDSDFGKVIKKASLAIREDDIPEIAITLYDSGALGTGEDLLAGVSLGTISMALLPTDAFAAAHPEWNILNLHGLFPSVESFNGWASLHAANLLNGASPDAAYRVLGVFATNKLLLCAQKSIDRAEDLKKLIVGIPADACEAAYWGAFGAATVQLPEINHAQLQQNGVDAVVCNVETARQQQLNTVYRYILPDGMGMRSYVLLIHDAAWDALRPEQQEDLLLFVKRVYALLASDEYRADASNFLNNSAWTVLVPTYEFRQALRNTAAPLAIYRRRLGAAYTDALLNSINLYNQGYPADVRADNPY